jgi:hypothetical protein
MLLCRYFDDCGRMGTLEGLFVCTQEDYDLAMGKEAWLDEPLGKHSECRVVIDKDNVKIIDISEEAISALVGAVGVNISGFNIVSIALEQYDEDNESE